MAEITVDEIKLKVVDYLAENRIVSAVEFVRRYVGSITHAHAFVKKVQAELEPSKTAATHQPTSAMAKAVKI